MVNRLLLLMLVLSALQASAQNEDCEITLSRGEDEFNAGHFYIIPSLLNPCLNQFTQEQRQRAYVLLTQTYLLLDDPIGARQSYLEVLKANPEFQSDTTLHPIDFVYLGKKFTSTAIFSWMVRAGGNLSPVRVIYDLSSSAQTTVQEEYKTRVGYHVAIGGDVNVSDKISARAEVSYLYTSYRHESRNYFRNPTYLTRDSKIVTDRQNWVAIPLTISYSHTVGKYRPYGYAGYMFHYLLSDKANIIINDQQPITDTDAVNGVTDSREESPIFNFLYKRNRSHQSIVFGAGLKMKVGVDFFFVDLRYTAGLKNMVNPKGSYADYPNYNSNEELSSELFMTSLEASTAYGYIEDYFRMDNISLSIGFLRPLYKPRELKRAKTRSVMRRIK